MVIVVLTLLSTQCGVFQHVATIGSMFGELPRALPSPHWPDLGLSRLLELINPAITIALLGAIESLLSAAIADGLCDAQHDPDQELMGQGVANLLAPLWGGFAATGAIARTATNARAGVTSPLSGIFHSLFLLAAMWGLAPLASRIPMAALAAVLFVVAFNMAHFTELKRTLMRAPMADKVIVAVTLILTVTTDIVVAVNVGVLLAALHFLRRMAHSVRVVDHPVAATSVALPRGVRVFVVQGPIFFAAAREFQAVMRATHSDLTMVLLRLDAVPFVDWTGIEALRALIEEFERRRVRVALIGANDRVLGKLRAAHVFERFPSLGVYATIEAAAQLANIAGHAV